MKALSLRQPVAYLAGAIVGDAWLTDVLGLRVADKDFSFAFAARDLVRRAGGKT
jgi:hypothetical protein